MPLIVTVSAGLSTVPRTVMGVTFVKLKSAGEVMLTTGAGTSVTLVLADAELPAASVAVTEIVPTPVLSEVFASKSRAAELRGSAVT